MREVEDEEGGSNRGYEKGRQREQDTAEGENLTR